MLGFTLSRRLTQFAAEFRLTDTQMRGLNSSPVTLVPAPGVSQVVVPRYIVWVAQTPEVTSADQTFTLLWGDQVNGVPGPLSIGTLNGNNEPTPVIDSAIQWIGPGVGALPLPIFDTGNPADCTNKPIQIGATANVTGGTGMSMNIMLSWMLADLTGLGV